jgi:hypothetical protein
LLSGSGAAAAVAIAGSGFGLDFFVNIFATNQGSRKKCQLAPKRAFL